MVQDWLVPSLSQICSRMLAIAVAIVTCSMASANTELIPIDVPPGHKMDNLLTRWKKPIYPWSALEQGITGDVTIEFDTDQNGGLTNVQVVGSTPPVVFDDAVLKTLNWWTVVPFRAMSCYTKFPRSRIKVNFGIEKGNPKVTAFGPMPLSDPSLASALVNADAPDSASRQAIDAEKDKNTSPKLRIKKLSQPEYPLRNNRLYPLPGDVAALFTVQPDGSIDKISITFSAPHPAFGEEAVLAIKSWRAANETGELPGVSRRVCVPITFRPPT